MIVILKEVLNMYEIKIIIVIAFIIVYLVSSIAFLKSAFLMKRKNSSKSDFIMEIIPGILCFILFTTTCLILIQGIKNNKDYHLSKNNEYSDLSAVKYISLSKDMIFMTQGKTENIDVILVNGTEEENKTGFSFEITDAGLKDVIKIEPSTNPKRITVRALKPGIASITVKNKFADKFYEPHIFVEVKPAHQK